MRLSQRSQTNSKPENKKWLVHKGSMGQGKDGKKEVNQDVNLLTKDAGS